MSSIELLNYVKSLVVSVYSELVLKDTRFPHARPVAYVQYISVRENQLEVVRENQLKVS